MKIFFTYLAMSMILLMFDDLFAQQGPLPPYANCEGNVAGPYLPGENASTDENGNYVLYLGGENEMLFKQQATGGTLPDNSFAFDVFRFNDDGSPLDTTMVISDDYVLDIADLGLSEGDHIDAYSVNYDILAIDSVVVAALPFCQVLEDLIGNDQICEVLGGVVDGGGITSLNDVVDVAGVFLGEINYVNTAVFNLDTLDQIIVTLGPIIGLDNTRVCFAYDGSTRIDIAALPDGVIFGCTDSNALNYNPDATDENGTCEYDPLSNSSSFIKGFNVVLHPNPASNWVNLQIEQAQENLDLTVYDLSGKVVKIISIDKGTDNIQMNVESWHSGIYMVQLSNRNKIIGSTKLVVE